MSDNILKDCSSSDEEEFWRLIPAVQDKAKKKREQNFGMTRPFLGLQAIVDYIFSRLQSEIILERGSCWASKLSSSDGERDSQSTCFQVGCVFKRDI